MTDGRGAARGSGATGVRDYYDANTWKFLLTGNDDCSPFFTAIGQQRNNGAKHRGALPHPLLQEPQTPSQHEPKTGRYLVRFQVDGAESPLDVAPDGRFQGPLVEII